jgi:hypothetical protein
MFYTFAPKLYFRNIKQTIYIDNMNKILHFSFFLIALSTFAQPVINSSDFDNLNISYTIKNATSSTLTEGASGANVIWNFSSMVLTFDPQTGIETVTQVPNGPFSSSFSNANYVFKSSSSNGSENFYSYYNKTANVIEELGGSTSSAVDYSYIDPYTLLVFPFTYGTVSTDSAQEVGQSSPISETITYDAYGTMITPFGTFNNVIRASRIQNNNYTDYIWYKTAPFSPILEVSQLSGGERDFTFYEPSTLSTQSFEHKSIYVFTSLSNEVLNIVVDNAIQIKQVNIIDLTGKKILQQTSNTNAINIENLANGIYLVQVDTNNGIFTQKFIKK